MDRRTFLATSSALLVVPAVAQALTTVEYAPGVIQSALDEGQTIFVEFGADWCSTCARQKRVINALRQENPAYDDAMKFVRVDWDEFKNHEVTTSRSIPRRSTLLVLQGDQELGRLVAGTSESQIKGLMDLGL